MAKLNILCCNPDGGAFLYITRGWEDAFKALGHRFLRWDGSDKQLEAFQPNIYLGCSGWRQNFPNWAKDAYGTKVAIHVNPWGKTVLQAQKGEPNINETKKAIEWVEKQNPDFLYCYGVEEDIGHMWNKWEDNIAGVIPVPCAGNAVAHRPVTPDPKFFCEVGFIGGFWPYKALNLRKYLVPVLDKTKAKVYGWGGWKHPKYLGQIKDEDVNKLFSSAMVCPSMVEPHTSRYGIDIPERMFKIPLAGGFTICDPCEGLDRYVNPEIFPIAKDVDDYARLINYYIKHDGERIKLRRKQRLEILKEHTYFSRIQGFLRFSGYEAEAEEAQDAVIRLMVDAE
jgi:hypothetical protein